ncbi:MAG: redoxin domain-containing protein [Elusimicrobiota bacterium]
MNKMLVALALALTAAGPLRAEIAPGQPAPDFTLNDQTGAPRKLSDAKGKYVVLEWWNKDCPFVRRHYNAKNMQRLQKKYTGKGVVWYSIDSAAEGKEGYLSPKAVSKVMTKQGMASTAVLLDPKGDVGRLYGAKTTPHMFVVDPKGNVIYMGAIDDRPSTDPADLKGAHNYVSAALDAAMAGQPVPNPVTKSYGCGVKY